MGSGTRRDGRVKLQDRKGEMGRTRTSGAPMGLRRGRKMGWQGGMGKGEARLQEEEGAERGQGDTRAWGGAKFGARVAEGS